MQWWTIMVCLNEPPNWSADESTMTLRTGQGTDFWQETHYGFRRDDGHLLHKAMSGDFDAEAVVYLDPNATCD